MRTRTPWYVALLAVAGCSDLAPIEGQLCGNAVVDPGEACDTFATSPGASCRMVAPQACRYECVPDGGEGPTCPIGMRCASDGLCRAPSGEVQQSGSVEGRGVRALLAANLGAAAGSEIIRVLERDLSVDYLGFAAEEVTVDARRFEPSVAPNGALPVAADLTGDGLADLLTPFSGGMFASVGGPTSELIPSAHPALSFANVDAVEVFFAEVLPEQPGQETLSFAAIADAGAIAYSELEGDTNFLAAVSGSPASLAGSIRVAQLDESADSPCVEIAFALEGEAAVQTLSPCRPAMSGGVEWNVGVEPTQVSLSAATVARGPFVVDLNADGHLDLLVEANCALCPALWASFGRGDGTFHSDASDADTVPVADQALAPWSELQLVVDGSSEPLKHLPLAMGHLDEDGVVDFVTEDAVWVSREGPVHTVAARAASDDRWALARIADFNGNELLDVVVATADEPDLRFFNGAPGGFLNEVRLPASAPATHLAVGDFDGDLIQDLATSEPTGERDALTIHFGRSAGPPESPVVVAELDPIRQLVVGRPNEPLVDGIDDLSAISRTADGPYLFAGFAGRTDRLIRSPFVVGRADGFRFLSSTPLRLIAGPFDDDPQRDVAMIGEGADGTQLWLIPTTDRVRFAPVATLRGVTLREDAAWDESAAVAIDVDEDGRDEVLLVAPIATDSIVQLFRFASDEDGPSWELAWEERVPWRFSRRERFGPLDGPESALLTLDGDGDGRAEVVAFVAEDGALWTWPNLSASSMGDVVPLPTVDGLSDIAVLEVDADLGDELALGSPVGLQWLGVGQLGLAQVSAVIWSGNAQRLATGDFDADGVDDVAAATGTEVVILRGRSQFD